MRKNVFLLSSCQALMMTGNSLLIATSALVGFALADDKSLATLPLALQFLGTMLLSIPASLLMGRIGRRNGFLLGTILGLAGAGIASYAIHSGQFVIFCLGTIGIGMFNGFAIYYRFAAVDTATLDYRSRAISYVMAGGVVAAIAGPNLANWSKEWLSGGQFLGSYTSLMGIYFVSFFLTAFIDIPRSTGNVKNQGGRPLRDVIRQSKFIVALIGAMLGYAVMSLVMTATPLAMRMHHHDFSDTAFVIQWHVLGMFAPSFITGTLIQRYGVVNIMLWGVLFYIACVAINLWGTEVFHFWVALACLGVGWNFLFIGGTSLLTETYSEEEKAKAQAFNDFVIYTSVTAAILTAGALQHHYGWRMVNYGVIPLIFVILSALLLQKRNEKVAPAEVNSIGL